MLWDFQSFPLQLCWVFLHNFEIRFEINYHVTWSIFDYISVFLVMLILMFMAVTMTRRILSMAVTMSAMAMSTSTMAMSMIVKQEKTDQVDAKTYKMDEQN